MIITNFGNLLIKSIIFIILIKMIDVNQYLIYLQDQQVHVCRTCKYCLQPNGTYAHLQSKHSEIPLKTRKKLVEYAKGLTLQSPSRVPIPTSLIASFECLKVTPGFQCLICGALWGTKDSMKEHCKDAHDWTKSKGTNILRIV